MLYQFSFLTLCRKPNITNNEKDYRLNFSNFCFVCQCPNATGRLGNDFQCDYRDRNLW